MILGSSLIATHYLKEFSSHEKELGPHAMKHVEDILKLIRCTL